MEQIHLPLGLILLSIWETHLPVSEHIFQLENTNLLSVGEHIFLFGNTSSFGGNATSCEGP